MLQIFLLDLFVNFQRKRITEQAFGKAERKMKIEQDFLLVLDAFFQRFNERVNL
jgi:hypothetical protein